MKRHDVLEGLHGKEKGGKERSEATKKRVGVDLRDLVAQSAGVPREDIGPQSALGLDLGMDSLSIMELLCLIEEEMGVYVEEGRLPHPAAVGDLEAILEDVQRAEALTPFPEWPLGFPARAARTLLQRTLMDSILALLCPTQARGLENLEDLSGPLLFAANHTSHLDTLVVSKVLPRRYHCRLSVAAAADYWLTNRLLGNLIALLFNSFPMARQGNVRPSMEHTVDLIDRGWSVLIYPEGTRSPSGEMQAFKPRMGLLAVELGVPVVPIHLRGVYAIRRTRWPVRLPLRPRAHCIGLGRTRATRQHPGKGRAAQADGGDRGGIEDQSTRSADPFSYRVRQTFHRRRVPRGPGRDRGQAAGSDPCFVSA